MANTVSYDTNNHQSFESLHFSKDLGGSALLGESPDLGASLESLCSLEVLEIVDEHGNAKECRISGTANGEADTESLSVRAMSQHLKQVKSVILVVLVVCGAVLALSSFFLLRNCSSEDEDEGPLWEGLYPAIVVLVYIIQTVGFLHYDGLVCKRHRLVSEMAHRSKLIVDSLFPSVVRNRLLKQAETTAKDATERNSSSPLETNDDVFPIIENKDHMKKSSESVFQSALSVSPSFSPVKRIAKPLAYSAKVLLASLDMGEKHEHASVARRASVKNFLTQSEGQQQQQFDVDEPIAEHFPDVTVFFADIAGFTAWSADRDPPQVFQLLETVYAGFDEIANRLKVFKVETIGDSYMAVTGLPDPDTNHAINMVRFSYQCIAKMASVTEALESVLGPGTKDLGIRAGLHSGPVTAGVLRGQKSRFQLFGDTVNTASRMESTGIKGKVQVSKETAALLTELGKGRWVRQREDKIFAKGKGELITYWVQPRKERKIHAQRAEKSGETVNEEKSIDTDEYSCTSTCFDDTRSLLDDSNQSLDINSLHEDKLERNRISVTFEVNNTQKKPIKKAPPPRRMPEKLSMLTASKRHIRLSSSARDLFEARCSNLIDWNTDVLLSYLQDVMKYRQQITSRSVMEISHAVESSNLASASELVTDAIIMPLFEPYGRRCESLEGEDMAKVERMLKLFISEIAVLYNDIPFHNFEHASHVCLAANKLLKKITTADNLSDEELHNRSFGISSDPLTQFAIILAALVHDVGHIGVPNSQLVKEEAEIALRYKNKSIAEQNSIAMAWQLLMEPRFEYLRSCIYKTNVERKRFRQVLINAVMATDIEDKEQLDRLNERWEHIFQHDPERQNRELTNMKATLAIEHIIQMANVAHTMQHWYIYRRWNERLLEENVNAHKIGRATENPVLNWYNRELAFFDDYVIPLTKRMMETGIFGDGGNTYVNNAQENRNEWLIVGKNEVTTLVGSLHAVAPVMEEDDDNEDSFALP